MGQTAACCVNRSEDEQDDLEKDRSESWHSLAEFPDEHWMFHDCEESESEGMSPSLLKRRQTFFRLRCGSVVLGRLPENRSTDDLEETSKPAVYEPYDEHIPEVVKRAREEWRRRQESNALDKQIALRLKDGFRELDDCTSQDGARRMLRAMNGNVEAASNLLVKAIECRVKDRDLFQGLHCQVTCDARVFGRDAELRPIMYFCARSQTTPLAEMKAQILLAAEASVRLTQADGRFILIADFHYFSPSKNMDAQCLKELAGTFGSVFAERLHKIFLIDFSFAANFIWTICKTFLSEKTKNKIIFANESKARKIIEDLYPESSRDRILSSFDINRDMSSTQEDREHHAIQTSICDVPLPVKLRRGITPTNSPQQQLRTP